MKPVLAITLLALAACSTPPDVTTPPVEMTYAPGNTRLVNSFDLTTVRVTTGSFTSTADVNNANCEAFGEDFTAKFSSPAILRLPLYRGRTEDVRVICKANVNGTPLAGATTIPARNLSAPQNEGVTISVGNRGSSIGAVFSLRDRKKDRFSYPNGITVKLR